jgi:hypothetical protein
MSSHTPGPWHIDPIKAHANGNRRIIAEQCTPVAVVPEHLAADARLIAAAPDMLECLMEVEELLAMFAESPSLSASRGVKAIEAALPNIRAVIARAQAYF